MSEGSLPRFNIPTTQTPLKGPEGVWSEYFGDEAEQQYMLNDIRLRHLSGLMQDGSSYYWLKRKLHGAVCPYWSDDAGQCRDPLNAKTPCFNTKFVGGYETPLEIKVALPSSNVQTLIQEGSGLMKMQEIRPWTVWAPKLSSRDILVNIQTGDRFEVLDIQVAGQWRGLGVAQFFNMRPLQLGVDMAMHVVVSTALRNIILMSHKYVGLLDIDNNGFLGVQPITGTFGPANSVMIANLDGSKRASLSLDDNGFLIVTPLNYTGLP